MGTLADGIKEIFSTVKTTGTNVMLCSNNGTPDGHITFDNLSDSLVVKRNSVQLTSSDNLDSCINSNKYHCSSTSVPSNAPTSGNSLSIYVNRASGVITQLAFNAGGTSAWCRTSYNYGSNWSNWLQFSFDIPDFYKSYQTLAALATALCASGVATDNVSNITTGFTVINSGATGAPTASGYFYAFCFGSGSKKAILALQTSINEGDAYFGLLNSGTVTWKKVSLT